MAASQGAWQSPQLPGFQPPPGFQQQQHQVMLQPVVPQRHQMRGALGVVSTKVLSSLLIACGASMIIVQIACTAITAEGYSYGGFNILGAGIWCGVIVTISGIIGLCAASWKSNGLVITFLVFNVLCTAFFSLIMISFTGIDLTWRYPMRGPYYSALVGMTSFLLLDAVVVFGISIWGIVSNSCAIQKAKACMYCCVESPSQTRPVIVYLPTNQASQINATARQVVPGGVAPMPQTFYAHGQNAFAGAAQASQIDATAGQVVPGGVAPVPQTFYAHGQSAFAGAAQETGAPIDPPPYKSLEES